MVPRLARETGLPVYVTGGKPEGGQFAEAALTAPEGVRSNLDVLIEVAKRLGVTVDEDWRTALIKRTSVVELELESNVS